MKSDFFGPVALGTMTIAMAMGTSRLTMGTPPRGCDLMDEDPFAPLFDLV